MSEYITLELDSDVMANIKKRADELGISEYDLLRYEIGAMHPNIKPLPFPRNEELANKILEVNAKAIAATGTGKCRSCLRQLSSDEILAGECECGEKI